MNKGQMFLPKSDVIRFVFYVSSDERELNRRYIQQRPQKQQQKVGERERVKRARESERAKKRQTNEDTRRGIAENC